MKKQKSALHLLRRYSNSGLLYWMHSVEFMGTYKSNSLCDGHHTNSSITLIPSPCFQCPSGLSCSSLPRQSCVMQVATSHVVDGDIK